ncbi:hypothetical protein MRB53_021852 [Persea americana]|nr:hypothetical protein MRB53_021852 [Persea americana]
MSYEFCQVQVLRNCTSWVMSQSYFHYGDRNHSSNGDNFYMVLSKAHGDRLPVFSFGMRDSVQTWNY